MALRCLCASPLEIKQRRSTSLAGGADAKWTQKNNPSHSVFLHEIQLQVSSVRLAAVCEERTPIRGCQHLKISPPMFKNEARPRRWIPSGGREGGSGVRASRAGIQGSHRVSALLCLSTGGRAVHFSTQSMIFK